MRLSGPMTRKICGGDIGDGFSIDTDELGLLAFAVGWDHWKRTRRRCSSSCEGTRGAMVGNYKRLGEG
jgi:hypothetical protein